MKYCILLYFLLIVNSLNHCFGKEISERSEYTVTQGESLSISLLTYSAGTELYALFGHSAIRIIDSINNSDRVYNYGTFDFDTPGFYFLFLKGNLQYSLSRMPFEYVFQSAILDNRSVYETPLLLTSSEKLELNYLLEENYLPHQRNYSYDFLFDNCATRILDILELSVKDSILIKAEVLPVNSFRELIKTYTKSRPWIQFGIDLLMGMQSDASAKLTEPAFLPDFLHLFIKNFYTQSNAAQRPIGGTDDILIQHHPERLNVSLSPSILFGFLAFLFLFSLLIDSYLRTFLFHIGNLIMVLFGIISFLLIGLWLLSIQYIFSWNIDLLWMNPLLLIIFLYRNSENYTALKTLLKINISLSTAGMLFSLLIEQNLGIACLALALVIHQLALLKDQKRRAYQ